MITFPALSTGATLDIRQEELRRLLSYLSSIPRYELNFALFFLC